MLLHCESITKVLAKRVLKHHGTPQCAGAGQACLWKVKIMLQGYTLLGIGRLEGQPVSVSDVLVGDGCCHPGILEQIQQVPLPRPSNPWSSYC